MLNKSKAAYLITTNTHMVAAKMGMPDHRGTMDTVMGPRVIVTAM